MCKYNRNMTDLQLLKDTFTHIYKEDRWNMGQNESKSGKGSTLDFALCISDSLIEVIQEYNIQTIVDTSCGDWNWMKRIQDKLCKYIGIDIVDSLIESNQKQFGNEKTSFVCSDFVSYLKGQADMSIDLVLCRHTCEHLPKDYIFDFFSECKRVAKFLLITTKKTYPGEACNYELSLPSNTYRPINLDLPPFDAFFKPFFVKEIYDGPISCPDPQMFIYLYKCN